MNSTPIQTHPSYFPSHVAAFYFIFQGSDIIAALNTKTTFKHMQKNISYYAEFLSISFIPPSKMRLTHNIT